MDRTLTFRRGLAGRLIQIAALAIPSATVATAAGCSGGDETGQGGAAATSSTLAYSNNTDPSLVNRCFTWPKEGAGGAGGTGEGGTGEGGAGGSAGSGGMGGGGSAACPNKADALVIIQPQCGGKVQTEGVLANGECCYDVLEDSCAAGRPFLAGGRTIASAPERARKSHAGAWTESEALAPDLSSLSLETRTMLSAAWARDGLLEHASVASFGRFALELMAAGAPADLLEMAHRAALDEVRHARLCLSLASAYAGEAITPAPFPFQGKVDIASDLADIAARAVKEGCIGETIAAVLAAEQHARAEDPAVRAVLAVIAEDEARHAELAWRAVAWAVRTGGETVRTAVAAALASAIEGAGATELNFKANEHEVGLAKHGRLDEAAAREAARRAVIEVVRPAAISLLSAPRTGEAILGAVAS